MKKKIYGIILVVIFGLILQNKCFCREYQIDSSNVEQELNFWNGWKLFHYGETTIDSKKGDVITYYTPVIVKGEYVGNYKSEATMRGYGYYSFDFNKHIVSLLSYMKNKITNYDTDFKPKNSDKESGLTVRDAIDNTINNILLNWYSKEYEESEFSEFWTKCISNKNSAIKKELKKLQNNFYFEAYAKNAIDKLESLMGEKFSDLTDNEVTALRGVVFSIMEARYRNKNFKGKTNFKLKVEEGDLIPFLVNIKNLNKITRNTITGKYEPKIEFPDFDEMIDGAYQYMYYYDSQVSNSTSHSTVTSIFNYQNETYEELEVDWEGEYDLLTGKKFPYLDSNRELEIFYTKCSAARTLFKKSKENEEGIFGAEEIYDIASETSYSEAMINMKNSMLEFASSVGGDINEVFSGLTEYNIERTYLMAKNIVENEAIQNEYAYYNIGTNVITFTPGIHGNEYLLIDFQKVSLKDSIMKFNGNTSYYTDEDTDGDNILDRNELGEENGDESFMSKKVDVTEFIKKMVEAELYGDDIEYKKTLEPHDRLNYSTNKKKQVNEVVSSVKYNIYNSRQEFLLRHGDDNIVDRKEQVEHYLNLDKNTSEVLEGIGNKAERIEYLKKGNGKLQVELYKYKSNPIFVDTDFDGYSDKVELERGYNAKSGLRKQVGLNAQVGSNININDTMDYRYFYMSNKNYYDELARMSLIMSNAVSNGNGGIETNAETEDLGYINTAMKSIGMQCTYKEISVGKLKTSFAIGHNEVEYYDLKKNIVLVAISNGKDITAYSQFEDYGKTNWSNSLNSNHSKGYEEVSDRIYKEIKNYLAVNKIDKEVVFWVTGYGTGGGVANILSSKLIDKPPVSTDIEVVKKKKIWMFTLNSKKVSVETGMTNVYSYTFGAPNVVYANDEYIGINDSRYKSIFNVVDANDVSAHMPSTKTGWHKYGFNMILNEKGEKCQEVINEYNLIMENKSRDDIYEKQWNDEKTMKEILEYVAIARGENDLNSNNIYFENMQGKNLGKYITFLNKYYAHYKDLEPKHSIKNYYDLCKKLLPEHMKIGDGWAMRTKRDLEYIPIKEALDTVGKWYVDNVYTYLAGNYGAERDDGDNLKMTNDYYNTSEVGKVRVEKNWHFPVNDEEYKENFIKRFNEKYKNVNATDVKDTENNVIKKSIKTKREDNIISKGENKNYLDTIQGSEIDKKWSENELCGRSNRGAVTIVGSETAKISQVDPITKKAKELEIITATKSVIIGGNQRGSYECDLFNNKTVGDDCTAFASAVIYKFIKDNQIGNYANYSYLNSWGSSHFLAEKIVDATEEYKAKNAVYILEKYGFKQYTADMIKEKKDFELQFGDLLCRKGHVEFYKGETNSNSFGWGDVHSSYDKNSGITYTANADGTFKGSESSELYTVIYRFEGLN